MKGFITVSANDYDGITLHVQTTLDPESYSERRTVRELIDYLLDYKPAKTEEPKKEEEEA